MALNTQQLKITKCAAAACDHALNPPSGAFDASVIPRSDESSESESMLSSSEEGFTGSWGGSSVPGSAIFVYSLAVRPGIDWTSLAAYVCTGVLQLVLLILCSAWKVRQKREGLDDYGRPVDENGGKRQWKKSEEPKAFETYAIVCDWGCSFRKQNIYSGWRRKAVTREGHRVRVSGI